jgi:hypothetical protein
MQIIFEKPGIDAVNPPPPHSNVPVPDLSLGCCQDPSKTEDWLKDFLLVTQWRFFDPWIRDGKKDRSGMEKIGSRIRDGKNHIPDP